MTLRKGRIHRKTKETDIHATVVIDGQEETVEGYDLSPNGITAFLDLKRPIYEQTAEYGHFGHAGFSWERADS